VQDPTYRGEDRRPMESKDSNKGTALALAGMAGIALLALIAIAFALPAAKSKPRDVPIGAVGAPAASGQVADMLEHSAPGAFALTIYPNEAALRDAIRDRSVYGGVVVEPDGRKLLTATGASPTVAQLLTQFGNGMALQTGVPLHTEDLAPPPSGDPRGTGLAAAALPVTLAGFLPVVALTLVVRRDVRIRIAATAAVRTTASTTDFRPATLISMPPGGRSRHSATRTTAKSSP